LYNVLYIRSQRSLYPRWSSQCVRRSERARETDDPSLQACQNFSLDPNHNLVGLVGKRATARRPASWVVSNNASKLRKVAHLAYKTCIYINRGRVCIEQHQPAKSYLHFSTSFRHNNSSLSQILLDLERSRDSIYSTWIISKQPWRPQRQRVQMAYPVL
jgi:hypothetical protein